MSLEGGGIKRARSAGGIQERKMKSRRRLNPKLDRGGESRRRRDFWNFSPQRIFAWINNEPLLFLLPFLPQLEAKEPEKIRVFYLFIFGFLGGDRSPLLSPSVPFLDFLSSLGRQSIKSDRSAGFIFLDL